MCTLVVEGTRLSLAVGFYQKTAKVGNQLVDLLGLRLPPCLDLCIQRVGSLYGLPPVEALGRNSHGRGEVHRQVYLDAVGSQDIGYLLHLVEVDGRKHLRRGVHVVEHRTVDADTGIGTGVGLDEFGVDGLGFPQVAVPSGLRVFQGPEDTESGITALNAAVEVVPMVQDPVFEERLLCLSSDNGHRAVLAPQQGEGAIK